MKFLRKYIRTILKETLEEDYPQSFNMETFKSLRNHAERNRYAAEHLQKIAAGSSRIVYKIDDEKVLKLAKNDKGIAQNETEIQWGNDYYFGSILARTFDSDDNGLWVEMELARKVTKSEFKKLTGFDISDVETYLRNWKEEMRGKRGMFVMDPQLKERMDEDEFIKEVIDFSHSANIEIGDFGRTSSYGIVKRDGHEVLVITDYGLTKDVYATHYDKSRKMAFYESEEKDEKTLFGFKIRIGGLENGVFNPDKEIFVSGNSTEEFMKNLDDQLVANGQPPMEGESRVNLYNKLSALEDKYRPKK